MRPTVAFSLAGAGLFLLLLLFFGLLASGPTLQGIHYKTRAFLAVARAGGGLLRAWRKGMGATGFFAGTGLADTPGYSF